MHHYITRLNVKGVVSVGGNDGGATRPLPKRFTTERCICCGELCKDVLGKRCRIGQFGEHLIMYDA